jgi:hypothetical protein
LVVLGVNSRPSPSEPCSVLSYEIDRKTGIVTMTGPEPTPDEAEAFFRKLLADPRYRHGDGILRDRREHPIPQTDLVRRVAQFFAQLPGFPGCRIAVVVPKNEPGHYGMMRMLQLLGIGRALEVAIFFDLESARAWLMETRDRETSSTSK